MDIYIYIYVHVHQTNLCLSLSQYKTSVIRCKRESLLFLLGERKGGRETRIA